MSFSSSSIPEEAQARDSHGSLEVHRKQSAGPLKANNETDKKK